MLCLRRRRPTSRVMKQARKSFSSSVSADRQRGERNKIEIEIDQASPAAKHAISPSPSAFPGDSISTTLTRCRFHTFELSYSRTQIFPIDLVINKSQEHRELKRARLHCY